MVVAVDGPPPPPRLFMVLLLPPTPPPPPTPLLPPITQFAILWGYMTARGARRCEKWVAKRVAEVVATAKCSATAAAKDPPSPLEVPRPSSSMRHRAGRRGVAEPEPEPEPEAEEEEGRAPLPLNTPAVSRISTRKVEALAASSSPIPRRAQMRPVSRTRAHSAGTRLPMWARMCITPVVYSRVDLPLELGPEIRAREGIRGCCAAAADDATPGCSSCWWWCCWCCWCWW